MPSAQDKQTSNVPPRGQTRLTFVVTSLERAGAQIMLLKLVQQLARMGFDQAVISLAGKDALSAQFVESGIRTHHLGIPAGRISIGGLRKLVNILRSENPDVIQGWMYHGNLAAQAARLFLSGPRRVVWSIRGTHTDLTQEKGLTALTIWLGSKLSRLPSAIIYNSAVSAQEHACKLDYEQKREIVIPNGFDTSVFAPSLGARERLRSRLGAANDVILIGLVARFHPVKDHSNFVEALARARLQCPKIRGVLVGEGATPDNRDLKALLARTSMTDFIYCLGQRSDVAEVTAALDIACNSSISEGFPNAIGEAMSCGVPCVVTDVGDSAWIVGDTGKVVRAQSAELFAAALSELLRMGKEARSALGQKARQRIVDRFSIDAVAGHYAATYRSLLERNV